jgi:hypothetical protein
MKLLNWVACVSLFTALGCGKDIGDACKSVNECITTDTNRLCLTEDGEGFPGGYCTKFNCGGTNVCPEEAVCVAYRYTLGGGKCDSDDTLSRLQRNYCMFRCDNDDDCRGGYKCLTADGDNPIGATIIDGQSGAKVCALEYFQPTTEPERESEVCEADGLRGASSSDSDVATSVSESDAAVHADAAVHVDAAVSAVKVELSVDAAASSTSGDAAVISSSAASPSAPADAGSR